MSIKDNVEHKKDWLAELKSGKQRSKVIIWDYRHLDELKTFWFSDIHLYNHLCDYDLAFENRERVLEKKMPCAGLGDLIENCLTNSVGSGIYEQLGNPQTQIEGGTNFYKPLADEGLLKCMQPGNHELRTWKGAAINLTKIMADSLGVPTGAAGVIHYILVGDKNYIGYSQHGGSASTTPTGKLTALIRMGDIVPTADFYIQGHTHESIYQALESFDFDKRSRTIKKHKRHFINNAGYLNYWDSYGQVKAYKPTNKGNAQLTFNGYKKQIEVSFV